MPFWIKKPEDKIDKGDDLESLTVDELIEWKLVRKQQVQAIQEELQIAHAVYTRKLIEWHAQEALKRVGLEGVAVSPGPAILQMKGAENDVA